jgi:predicted ATP-binding protein involved in virulence
MRLAAIYIPQNSLPYIFGKDHLGQTLNLGGANRYSIIENEENIKISLDKKNEGFIEWIWGDNISLITSIVGKNGVGKTTILRAINHSADTKNVKCLYLFEGEEVYKIYNELKQKNIETELDYAIIDTNAFDTVKLYYSPLTDFKLLETKSPYNIVYEGDKSLNEIYLKQINQNILFLHSPISDNIREVYRDFPHYDKLEISIPNLRKFDFKNIYGTSNLGNEDRAQVLKTYIKSDISKLIKTEEASNLFTKASIIDRLENYVAEFDRKGLNSLFDEFWGIDEYKSNNDQDYLHDGEDFLKNFEIQTISYLILGATFPRSPFQKGHDKDLILAQSSFPEKLNGFLELYLANCHGDIRETINKELGKIDIKDYEKIKEIIERDKNSKYTISGFSEKDAIRLMLSHLEKFKHLDKLYRHLKDIVENERLTVIKGKLIYDLKEHDISILTSLISKYDALLSNYGHSVMNVNLLSFNSNKILSSGENALLNFYARIHNYLNRIKNSEHQCFDYYLLLLDEPELGYHPYWKKKFVNAVRKTLPVLFKMIKPSKSVFTGKSKSNNLTENPILQIIFTTHDPLTLSDIPNTNILYLDKNDKEETFILDEFKQQKKSFGANIHDLLADSFFLHNGFMGEFVEEIIIDLSEYLSLKLDFENVQASRHTIIELTELKYTWNEKMASQVINIIDEPLIKERLQLLFDEKFLFNKKEALRLRISQMTQQLNKLEDEKN